MANQKERDAKEGGKGKKEREGIAQNLRRLSEEVALLRSAIQAPQPSPKNIQASPLTRTDTSEQGSQAEWNELLSVLRAVSFSDPLRPSQDETVAQFGFAFSSAPKVTLIRLLLENGPQPAATLGDGANLTTGSLYHHLRELIHAQVVVQEARSRYALTEQGRRVARLLFALAQM